MSEDDEEQLLAGGVVNHVVRIGNTVRRPTGSWTSTVHSMLRHLEARKFPYSPRVLGLDDLGREVLTFIDGVPALRPWPAVMRSDTGIASIGHMLGELCRALADFNIPDDATWRSSLAPAPPGATSVRHGDVGPWNMIWRSDRLVGLVDWDMADLAPPLWDVAQAAWYAVPLYRGEAGWKACGFAARPDLARRLKVLCSAYGAEPGEVLDALRAVLIHERSTLALLAGRGIEPYAQFADRGDLHELDCEMSSIDALRPELLAAR